jgi:hypothetical protein
MEQWQIKLDDELKWKEIKVKRNGAHRTTGLQDRVFIEKSRPFRGYAIGYQKIFVKNWRWVIRRKDMKWADCLCLLLILRMAFYNRIWCLYHLLTLILPFQKLCFVLFCSVFCFFCLFLLWQKSVNILFFNCNWFHLIYFYQYYINQWKADHTCSLRPKREAPFSFQRVSSNT